MYKVQPVPGGYQVFWVEKEGLLPRPVRVEPYRFRQSAYLKAKHLNDAAKCSVNDCQEIATVNCEIGACAPRTQWCDYHYEQAHLPEDERDNS